MSLANVFHTCDGCLSNLPLPNRLWAMCVCVVDICERYALGLGLKWSRVIVVWIENSCISSLSFDVNVDMYVCELTLFPPIKLDCYQSFTRPEQQSSARKVACFAYIMRYSGYVTSSSWISVSCFVYASSRAHTNLPTWLVDKLVFFHPLRRDLIPYD